VLAGTVVVAFDLSTRRQKRTRKGKEAIFVGQRKAWVALLAVGAWRLALGAWRLALGAELGPERERARISLPPSSLFFPRGLRSLVFDARAVKNTVPGSLPPVVRS